MAKLVFGMNQSLDGYVDHMAFAPSPVLFRHFIEEAEQQAGRTAHRDIYAHRLSTSFCKRAKTSSVDRDPSTSTIVAGPASNAKRVAMPSPCVPG